MEEEVEEMKQQTQTLLIFVIVVVAALYLTGNMPFATTCQSYDDTILSCSGRGSVECGATHEGEPAWKLLSCNFVIYNRDDNQVRQRGTMTIGATELCASNDVIEVYERWCYNPSAPVTCPATSMGSCSSSGQRKCYEWNSAMYLWECQNYNGILCWMKIGQPAAGRQCLGDKITTPTYAVCTPGERQIWCSADKRIVNWKECLYDGSWGTLVHTKACVETQECKENPWTLIGDKIDCWNIEGLPAGPGGGGPSGGTGKCEWWDIPCMVMQEVNKWMQPLYYIAAAVAGILGLSVAFDFFKKTFTGKQKNYAIILAIIIGALAAYAVYTYFWLWFVIIGALIVLKVVVVSLI